MMIQQVKIVNQKNKTESSLQIKRNQNESRRTIELEAIRSFKRKVKEKRHKAMQELQEFFDRSSCGSDTDDSSPNEFLDIIQPQK
mmetsp:Transcript_14512/g.16224  ORF Transcript_14512/g.16224 Transcript_14512/m.16224 type:complete len:85 (+) Transcript_14512:238-492(+)